MINAIITDIEGTTTDIDFVHKVLFPYSRQQMQAFIKENQHLAPVAKEMNEVRQYLHDNHASVDTVCDQLIAWIDEDRKIAPLKNIQGYIWQHGFETGQYQGHVYKDAYQHLSKWHQAGIKLYVYSSGSVKAQQLLFQYSVFGDMRGLFSGYFDTQVGAKKESASYANILQSIQYPAQETLFLSDVVAELDAAKQAGLFTALLNRAQVKIDTNHPQFASFDEIIPSAY